VVLRQEVALPVPDGTQSVRRSSSFLLRRLNTAVQDDQTASAPGFVVQDDQTASARRAAGEPAFGGARAVACLASSGCAVYGAARAALASHG